MKSGGGFRQPGISQSPQLVRSHTYLLWLLFPQESGHRSPKTRRIGAGDLLGPGFMVLLNGGWSAGSAQKGQTLFSKQKIQEKKHVNPAEPHPLQNAA